METASWVIYRNFDNAVMFETFNEKIVAVLNTEKYRAVPILEHLASINRALNGITINDLARTASPCR